MSRHENTPITNILDKGDYIYSYSNKKKIKSKKVVVGCNGYLDRLLSKIRSRFMPINNYVIATEPLGEKKARDLIRNNHAVCDTRFTPTLNLNELFAYYKSNLILIKEFILNLREK